MVCPRCKGEGKIRAAFRQSGYDQIIVPCIVCKGTGKKPYYTPPTP
ncbi:hypothetical protein GMSM_44900 [Geomonas sp. Red276]